MSQEPDSKASRALGVRGEWSGRVERDAAAIGAGHPGIAPLGRSWKWAAGGGGVVDRGSNPPFGHFSSWVHPFHWMGRKNHPNGPKKHPNISQHGTNCIFPSPAARFARSHNLHASAKTWSNMSRVSRNVAKRNASCTIVHHCSSLSVYGPLDST